MVDPRNTGSLEFQECWVDPRIPRLPRFPEFLEIQELLGCFLGDFERTRSELGQIWTGIRPQLLEFGRYIFTLGQDALPTLGDFGRLWPELCQLGPAFLPNLTRVQPTQARTRRNLGDFG